MNREIKAFTARKQAAMLGDEARRAYMIYLAAKKRWLAKVDEAAELAAPEPEKDNGFCEKQIKGESGTAGLSGG